MNALEKFKEKIGYKGKPKQFQWGVDLAVDEYQAKVEHLETEIAQLKTKALPSELTPLIKSVLGVMCFKTSPYAHVYQAAGFDIPKKTEEEQAFMLHRWLLLALQHGDNWTLIAQKEVDELRAKTEHGDIQ